MGADLAKIAVTAHDLADAAPVLDLLGQTDQDHTPTVAFAMGDDAWPTRVLACVYGAPYVYASVAPGLDTAPGQPTVAQLTGVFDVRRFSRSTAIYGVLGKPVAHSWSPELHNRVFRRLEFDAVYLPFATSHPAATVAMLSRCRLRGLSVTAPHKTVLLPQCQQVDEATAATGALNTLSFMAHGVVRGYNTDVLGVREAFLGAGLPTGPAPAVVLGGGGAARAAALALSRLGMRVTMMPRSLEPVREFAKAHGFQLARLDAGLLGDLRPRAVVNATPVGGPTAAAPGAAGLGEALDQRDAAGGGEDGQRILPDWEIRPGTYVLDMVYQTRWTPLLRAVAGADGVPVFGVDMFLAQAREQVYHFTGRRLSIDVLAELVGQR
jgi:3-dehydroquinate dehydratase/shikimate dehydrogenase